MGGCEGYWDREPWGRPWFRLPFLQQHYPPGCQALEPPGDWARALPTNTSAKCFYNVCIVWRLVTKTNYTCRFLPELSLSSRLPIATSPTSMLQHGTSLIVSPCHRNEISNQICSLFDLLANKKWSITHWQKTTEEVRGRVNLNSENTNPSTPNQPRHKHPERWPVQ